MNEPLTLEQLKSKSDEPVYVKLIGKTNSISHDGWAFLDYCLYDTEFVAIWWPGSDVQDFGFFEDYGKTWLAYAYPPVHIDREAWKSCKACTGCASCRHSLASGSDSKSACFWCDNHNRYKPRSFCPECGRPLTEEAWEELEKRVRGEKWN